MAAGKGTRMLPITLVKPKALIKVAGKPFIQHLFDRLFKAGYKDIGIVLGYKKEMIEDFIKEKKYDIKIIEQKELTGTGEAVRSCKDFVGDEDFIIVSGDNLYSSKDLANLNKKDEFCYVCTYEGDPEGYGQVVSDNGFLNEIVEKPEEKVSDRINIGLYKFTSDIFDAIKKIKPSERGELEITDAINLLAKEKKVKLIKIKDYWLDLINPEHMYEVSEFLTENGNDEG